MHYVYILQSKRDGKLYVGCSKDLRKRILLHNSGKISSTQKRRPLEVIYYEAHKSKEDAFAREQFLKSGWGRNYIKRILKHYFQSKNLGGEH